MPTLTDISSWTDRLGHSKLRTFKADGGRFWLEQNAGKSSKWAILARKGHVVAWEFESEGGAYSGRLMVDGEIMTSAEATKRFFKK